MLKIQKNEVTIDLCVCSLAKHGMYKQKKECSVCEPLVRNISVCWKVGLGTERESLTYLGVLTVSPSVPPHLRAVS